MAELKTFKGKQWAKRPATESGTTSLAKLTAETGASVRDLVEANGITWAGSSSYVAARLTALGIPGAAQLSFAQRQVVVRENDINDWAAKNGGICDENAPAAKGTYGLKVRGCLWGQWAVLNAKSIIWLPARPQDLMTAASAAAIKPKRGIGTYLAGGGLLLLGGALYRRRKQRRAS